MVVAVMAYLPKLSAIKLPLLRLRRELRPVRQALPLARRFCRNQWLRLLPRRHQAR